MSNEQFKPCDGCNRAKKCFILPGKGRFCMGCLGPKLKEFEDDTSIIRSTEETDNAEE